MNADTFVSRVMSVVRESPDVQDTSFLRSSIKAIGRKFESRALDSVGAVGELERLLPWQLSRDMKKSIEKALR